MSDNQLPHTTLYRHRTTGECVTLIARTHLVRKPRAMYRTTTGVGVMPLKTFLSLYTPVILN